MKTKNLLKKAFLLLALMGGASSAWADPVTIGLTQVNDGVETGDYKGTLAAAAYVGTTNVTVSEAHGAGCGINQSGRTTTGPDGNYNASKCFRKTVNSSTWDNTEWVGYSMVVASGYKVSLTNLKATLWDANSSATYTWRVVVENGSGTALYTSATKTSSTSEIGIINVASPDGLSNIQAGTYYVKLYLYQSGGNKYFSVPYLTVDATVEEDQSTSYTVTTSAGAGGTVSPSGENSVVEGQDFAVMATPNTGYAFVNWTLDGADGGTSNPLSINNVTANHTAVANFKQLYSISYNVDAANKGTASTGLDVQYANASNKWTAVTNYYTFKEGYTLTKWNDGENDYTPGTEYTLAGNITVAPIFTENAKNLSDLTAETTISWPFATNNGAPTLSSEGNTQYYVKQTTIAGETVDVPIYVNTTQDYGISGKKGKFVSSATNCQVNAGTVFKIPAIQGMVVKYMTSQTTAVGNIGFTDNTENLGGDGTALTTPTVISGDNKTISYTYTGTASYLYLVDKAGGKYPTGISVTYPEKKTKYLAPTITVGDFSFADKAYPVTITAVEGTLYVSTDGENYTVQTSPYEVNVTTTTQFYAKATGASYDDSEVVDENVTNTFDGVKSYVAWVYESNYANAAGNYNIANDAIHTALGTVYNVVNVDIKDYKSSITDDQKTALKGNLDDADLVVLSEAAAGSSKAVIGLKDLVGTVPMLNMKLFAYSDGRWAWGTPANKGTAEADVIITPVSKLYKVLNGVTFDGNNVALFDYPNDGYNHIQYVDSWTAKPAGDVVLANVSSKPAMHASTSQKYFALGLSCDDFTKYNSNAIAIVKNAAAMLIAGENLDAEQASTTITPANNWSTYVTPYALDFSDVEGLKAYVATAAANGVVTLDEVGTVPAGTPLMLVGTASTEYTVPVIAPVSAPAVNMFRAGDGTTEFDGTTYDYILYTDGKFYQIGEGSVPVGKAYLHCGDNDPTTPHARELRISFGDNITDINQVDNGQLKTVGSLPVKRIVNGKLVIEKKGVIFNAAGQKLSK